VNVKDIPKHLIELPGIGSVFSLVRNLSEERFTDLYGWVKFLLTCGATYEHDDDNDYPLVEVDTFGEVYEFLQAMLLQGWVEELKYTVVSFNRELTEEERAKLEVFKLEAIHEQTEDDQQ
jgi:hypothetical protein